MPTAFDSFIDLTEPFLGHGPVDHWPELAAGRGVQRIRGIVLSPEYRERNP